MLSTSILIEIKDKNGEDDHVCNLTLSGSRNEASTLIETLLKEEFERPDSRIDHLSIKRVGIAYETEIMAKPKE